jgi:hypothetical protein
MCHKPLLRGVLISVGAKAFDRRVARNDIPVIVDFWGPLGRPMPSEPWLALSNVPPPSSGRTSGMFQPRPSEEPALLGERTEGRPTRRRLSTKIRAMKQSTAG